MKGRIERVKAQISTEMIKQDFIQAIALIHQQDEDLYDPYFALSFDIFYSGECPPDRDRFYGDIEFIESNLKPLKDRILIDNLPVRIEYKKMIDVESSIAEINENTMAEPRSISFLINRLQRSEILYDKKDWLKNQKEKLNPLPQHFWDSLKNSYSIKMEHYLNDLRAAAMRKDPFFFEVSLGNFLQISGALLMAANKLTEPSLRYFNKILPSLSILPDGFKANLESLVRTDEELTMERKSEVAALFTRSILGLLPSY